MPRTYSTADLLIRSNAALYRPMKSAPAPVVSMMVMKSIESTTGIRHATPMRQSKTNETTTKAIGVISAALISGSLCAITAWVSSTAPSMICLVSPLGWVENQPSGSSMRWPSAALRTFDVVLNALRCVHIKAKK